MGVFRKDTEELKETSEIYLGKKLITAIYNGFRLVYIAFSRFWRSKNIWKHKSIWKY